MYVFSALPCIIKELTLLTRNKVSSLKTYCYTVNAFIIGIWQLGFRLKAHLQTPKSMANEYISQTWLNRAISLYLYSLQMAT